MTITPSAMLPLGTIAPDFSLLNVTDDKYYSLQELQSNKATVIMFICNHCPFVKHVKVELAQTAKEYTLKGIAFIAINANDFAHYPADAPDKMREMINDLGNPFVYLLDETQDVAKAYHAACTPDLFLFDGDMRCVYRGQFDDSRPDNNIPVTGKDLRSALDNLLAGRPISSNQKPSTGCNIKWKSSN